MLKAIVHLIGPLLRLLLPPTGRHRPWSARPSGRHRASGPAQRGTGGGSSSMGGFTAYEWRDPWGPVFRGEDIPLVRPYLVVHEREQNRLRSKRRANLVVVVEGFTMAAFAQTAAGAAG
ncbi:hypothetical protein FFZ77_03760 [Streptomyces katsurahamanus]|uniref:Uncharacterized protein n=1 Tax=Streptomyces katsurahamanus TaxID=2577098 RepID=A0ABW9NNB2_9ACTN|nr:hypothetical protein [Streptomyces katsurahamanus]